jgi:hypothetical protein
MTSIKKIPPIVQIGAWVLTLFVFAVGFWHTHLGLKEMKPFGSEWGGLVIASIVLLLLLITYWFAVNGRKMALVFYILCGFVFFICNLNYFYPAYLSRQLVKEEATLLNDTLQNYSNKAQALQKTSGFKGGKQFDNYQRLNTLKDQIVTEVRDLGGFYQNSQQKLDEFNKILKEYGNNGVHLTNDNSDKAALARFYEGHLNAEIQALLASLVNKGGDLADAVNFVTGIKELDSLQIKYTTILKDSIIPDNSTILLENVASDKQIDILQKLVTGLNGAISKINNSSGKVLFHELEEAQTRNLGKIAHTLKSIKNRSDKTDTWAIIILCLFVDLIVPLAIYLLLRKKGDEPEDKLLQGKIKPTSF